MPLMSLNSTTTPCAVTSVHVAADMHRLLSASDQALARDKIHLVDRQLACMPTSSKEGQVYLAVVCND